MFLTENKFLGRNVTALIVIDFPAAGEDAGAEVEAGGAAVVEAGGGFAVVDGVVLWLQPLRIKLARIRVPRMINSNLRIVFLLYLICSVLI